MSTYVPNNQYVFFQAFAGAVAGLLGQSTSLTTVPGSYTATIKIAGAWAQEVDTQWGLAGNPDAFQYDEIFAFSNDLFQVFDPPPDTGTAGVGSSTNPATYSKSALALIQLMNDAETYLSSLEIVTPTLGQGSLNFVRTQISVGISTQTQSNANPVALAAIAVQQKGNGLWAYDIDVSFANNTTAKTVELRAVLVPFTTVMQPFTQLIGNINSFNPEVGPLYAGVNPGNLVAQLSHDAAGITNNGLLYGGTAPVDTAAHAVTLWDQSIQSLTGLLNVGDWSFNAHGVAGYTSAGVQHNGFAQGNWAVLVLELVSTNGGDIVSFGPLSMSLREIA